MPRQKKPEKIKTENTNHFEEIKKYLIKNKIDFEMILTNYTAEIKSPFNIKASKNTIEKRAFIGFNKIKKDLREYTANELPTRKDFNQYYDSREENFNLLNKQKKLFNIDLTAAYLTILFNDGFISFDTFNFCYNLLTKEERLQCVGMLASKKTIFRYERGELVNAYQQIKETEGVFFYCVDRTAQIINKIKEIISPESFVFSWVDSVYYLNDADTEIIGQYLTSIDIKYKYKILENVSVQETANFYFLKHGFTAGKNIFNIPKKENDFKKSLLKILKLM